MNKTLIWLPALLTVGVGLYKPVKEASTPKIEDKAVSLVIYKAAEYNSPVYDNSTARVHVVVEKVNTKGQRTIVWNKMLTEQSLSDYPSFKNAASQTIEVPNVNKNKEHLEVNYTLIYNSRGVKLQMQGADVLSGKNNNVNIRI